MVVNKRRRESRSHRYNPLGGGSSWAREKVRQQSVPVPNRLALSWLPPGVDVGYSGYRGRVVLAAPRVRVMRSPSHFALTPPFHYMFHFCISASSYMADTWVCA